MKMAEFGRGGGRPWRDHLFCNLSNFQIAQTVAIYETKRYYSQ